MSLARALSPATASFDEDWYLAAYPDVADAVDQGAMASGYAHWVERGHAEDRIAPPGFFDGEAFDEAAYLRANPDVAAAILKGAYDSGRQHFLQDGSHEGRLLRPPATPEPEVERVASFDEDWYLSHNPDIAAAVASGVIRSGYLHWADNGRFEGRDAPPGFDIGLRFDEPFYLRSYPAAARDLAAQRALNARHHYESLGRFRGYLPNELAERPDAPARQSGAWLDAPNALDLIEGRLDLGQVTLAQAKLLAHWVHYGYVILPEPLPAALVDRAAAELRRAFDGGLTGARFACPALNPQHPVPWDPAVKQQPAEALDLHWLSPGLRDLVLAPPVLEMLELLFGRRAMAGQSSASLRGTAQEWRRDAPAVPFSMPGQSVGAWFALEDAPHGAGEPKLFPGSHTLPQRLVGGKYRTVHDAVRLLSRPAVRDDLQDDPDQIEQQCLDAGLSPITIRARKGDLMIWHPALVHGALPDDPDRMRGTATVHFCPGEIVPLGFERGTGSARTHKGIAWYASAVYPDA